MYWDILIMYYMIGMQYSKRYWVFYYMYLSWDGSLVSAIEILLFCFVGEEGIGYRYMVKYL